MLNLLYSIVVLVSACAGSTYAGYGRQSGGGRHDWDDDGFSVIVARVLSVKEVGNHGVNTGGSHVAELQPAATLAGHFDPSANSSLEVRFYVGDPMTSIENAPPIGALVLAVIHHGFIGGDEKQPYVSVISDECTFMPDGSSLVRLSGLDDKRVVETLERIREARAKSEDGERDPK